MLATFSLKMGGRCDAALFFVGSMFFFDFLAVLAPSWRHLGSIWEGLGLDFGWFLGLILEGVGLYFGRFLVSILESVGLDFGSFW